MASVASSRKENYDKLVKIQDEISTLQGINALLDWDQVCEHVRMRERGTVCNGERVRRWRRVR